MGEKGTGQANGPDAGAAEAGSGAPIGSGASMSAMAAPEPILTVAQPASEPQMTGDRGTKRRSGWTEGEGASGSITHPSGEKLEKDEGGDWTYTSPDGSTSDWVPGAKMWRNRDTTDKVDLPPPEDLARRLSLGDDAS